MLNELNDIRRCDAKVNYKGFAPDCVHVCNPRACFLVHFRKRLARAETAEANGFEVAALDRLSNNNRVFTQSGLLHQPKADLSKSQKTCFNAYRFSLRQTPSAFTMLKSSCLEGKSLLPSYATTVTTCRNG